MKRRRKPKALKPEVQEASVVYFQGVLLSLMQGMLRAKDVEERYVVLRDRIRESTEQEIESLARKAAEYWVEHITDHLTREDVEKLKKAAFDHALST